MEQNNISEIEIEDLMDLNDHTFMTTMSTTPLNRRRQIVKGLEIELYRISCMIAHFREKNSHSEELSYVINNMESIALLESVKARTEMRVAYVNYVNHEELAKSRI